MHGFHTSCDDKMVHPTPGKTISSYKHLMRNPATAETWQTAFGKDFGGMAQGDKKTGQKGTNSIFVMTHAEISNIPKDRTVTYAQVVINVHPQKADPHWIRITAGGNLISYPHARLTSKHQSLCGIACSAPRVPNIYDWILKHCT
jgi:hypothetical protein